VSCKPLYLGRDETEDLLADPDGWEEGHGPRVGRRFGCDHAQSAPERVVQVTRVNLLGMFRGNLESAVQMIFAGRPRTGRKVAIDWGGQAQTLKRHWLEHAKRSSLLGSCRYRVAGHGCPSAAGGGRGPGGEAAAELAAVRRQSKLRGRVPAHRSHERCEHARTHEARAANAHTHQVRAYTHTC